MRDDCRADAVAIQWFVDDRSKTNAASGYEHKSVALLY